VDKRSSQQSGEAHKIIDSLQHDHAIIKKKMKLLINTAFLTTSWGNIYNEFKALLSFHIEKEDKYLYPFLRSKASQYPELAVVLDEFDSEISVIAQLVKELDEKIQNGSNYIAQDFEYLYIMIIFRMSLEEETLFKDFGNVIKLIENHEEFTKKSAIEF
jgi:hypothetical protein